MSTIIINYSTQAIIAIDSASPLQKTVLITRVYPPLRFANSGAISANIFQTAYLPSSSFSKRMN